MGSDDPGIPGELLPTSRALVEENLKADSGGRERVRKNALRGEGAVRGAGRVYSREREPGEREPGVQGAAREE